MGDNSWKTRKAANLAKAIQAPPRVEKPIRTEKGRFVPGVSGNPYRNGGRPKGFAGLLREATSDGEDLATALIQLTQSPDERVRLDAIKECLNRMIGKAVETTVQLSLEGKEGSALSALTTNQLAALLGLSPEPMAVERLQTVDSTPVLSEGSKPPGDTD